MIEPSDGQARAPVVAPTAPRPLPGQAPLVAAALAIGVLLLGLQLWLLTVALDLFLAGGGEQIGLLALVSGLIFAGGVLVLWVLRRRPRMRRPRPDEARFAVGAWGTPGEGR